MILFNKESWSQLCRKQIINIFGRRLVIQRMKLYYHTIKEGTEMIRDFIIPTPAEIEVRRKMYDEAEILGIDLMGIDDEKEPSKEEKDYIRKAIILLKSGKDVPEEIKKHLPLKQQQ
jgi:hypothetical protein